MAVKKAVKRTVRSAKKAATPRVNVVIPEGYEVIAGSFGTKWDYEQMPILEGIVTRKDTLDVGKGRNKRAADVMEVENVQGKFSIWKSAALGAFFDKAQIGDSVAIAYLGEKKVAGQRNPMHDFSAGIKAGTKKGRSARK